MKKLLQASAAVLAGISIAVPGLVSAHTGSIDTTGPDSVNTATFHEKNRTEVRNNNNLHLNNMASQVAATGDAMVYHNTTAGDAGSGDAANDNSVMADVAIDNTSAAPMGAGAGAGDSSADISNTGPDSKNKVEVKSENTVKVTNNNNVCLNNTVSQVATSGDVKVSGNTTGGNATSGDASNTSSSSFTLSINN